MAVTSDYRAGLCQPTVRSVQELLGHANIQTTSRYISLAEEQLHEEQLHKDVQDHAL